MAQGFDTAFGLFPGQVAGLFEADFKEHAAVAFFEGRGDFAGLHGLAGEIGGDQSCEDFFRFEAEMELVLLDSLSQFVAEAFAFDEHADQAALDGLGGAADQFWLGLYFAAALRSGFAESGPEDRLVEAQLLCDARRPFGTYSIWIFWT